MEAAMSYYEKISCRIAIQVCVGCFPDGRERHRTFSIKGINPRASLEAIADIIRALAQVLACPITKVRKVVKREIIFYEEAAMPIPQIIPFPVPGRLVAREAAVILPFPSPLAELWSMQMGLPSKRAPPGDYLSLMEL